MKILFTGASGFIGSNMIQFYLDKNIEVLNIDKNEPKNKNQENIWQQVDITNKTMLANCVTDFDPTHIIHLAARTDLDGKNMGDYASNTDGTLNLLEAATKLKNLKRILFTSSMLVCRPGYQPKSVTDFAPSTIYGESKVDMEKLIRTQNPEFEWAIVRPTSIWGPGFGIPYRTFFDMVMSRKYFHIGKRACVKTYGYIGNVVEQIDAILKAPKEEINSRVFYLGDYEPTNIEDWANEIGVELDIKIRTIPFSIIKLAALFGDFLKLSGFSFPMTSFRLKNMTTDNIIDLSDTQKLLPILPYSRIVGIRHTLDWLKQNQ